MIKGISLSGFKSFLYRDLNLNRLTLLTGLNSTGKSSIIQAILMLSKAVNVDDNILLEGYGSVDEIKNNYFKENPILGIEHDKGVFRIEIPLDESYKVVEDTIGDFLFPEIIYISAHRFGPKTFIPIFNESEMKYKIGPNGENLFQCIDFFSDHVLDSRLRHKNSEGDTLLYNIRGWLSVIAPNVEFKHHLNKITDSSYSTFDEHRAANVGFGLSYILPVITALLVGTLIPNSLVIIENPEAHLHPRGQTEIARLISLCAQVGTQIIIETHSDHLFDGIRIEAKKTPGFAKDVQIHWFELDKDKNTEVYSPTLHDDGRLDEWPKGFFDQFEINSSELL